VSVVMPSYNSGRFLRTAIESVLATPEPTVELLIQDGQSEDETQAVVQSFDDPRIHFRSEPDDGQSDAVNRAISNARGDWVLWLNADDALAPHALTRLWQCVSPEVDVVHGDWDMVDEDGRLIRRYRCAPLSHQRVLKYGPYVYNGAILVRRSMYETVGGLDTSLRHCMDFELLLRLCREATVRHCGEVVALFRVQPDSKTSTEIWAQFGEHWQIARKHGASRPRQLPRTLISQAYNAAYILTLPLWHSRMWSAVRREKRRGGLRA
jgi:glycosyltransferase involved in cell wall biosynthesis